jgi:hypothetical protein
VSYPNSTTARNNFLGAILSPGVENFQSFTLGAVNGQSSSFPGFSSSIVATFTGSGQVRDVASGFGTSSTYPTSVARYLFFETGNSFTITFSTPIAAFGFLGTDTSDSGSTLRMTFNLVGGGSIVQEIAPANGRNGSVNFFGLVGGANEDFFSVTFTGVAGSDDFGFDDLVIGDREQVNNAVPEPSTWAMLSGALMLGAWMRRRR